jgi:hypothetical protein
VDFLPSFIGELFFPVLDVAFIDGLVFLIFFYFCTLLEASDSVAALLESIFFGCLLILLESNCCPSLTVSVIVLVLLDFFF